jgi:hypothetical protein
MFTRMLTWLAPHIWQVLKGMQKGGDKSHDQRGPDSPHDPPYTKLYADHK